MAILDVPGFMIVLRVLANGDDLYGKEFSLQYLYTKTKITYSHLLSIINLLENRGFIEKNKIGRMLVVNLTESGEKVGETIVPFFNAMGIKCQ